MTFIISEDDALKKKLQGMTVTDQKSTNDGIARQVAVFYGQPDQEIRSQSYPYVTIDLINFTRDTARETRFPASTPEYLQPDPNLTTQKYVAFEMVPINLDYQITTWSRNPLHDREIMSQLLTTKLPIRYGTLDVVEAIYPITGGSEVRTTTRRLDVLGVMKRDAPEQGKRLHSNVITVRISSEIAYGKLEQLYEVLSVHIDNPTVERAGGRGHAPHFDGVGAHTIQ